MRCAIYCRLSKEDMVTGKTEDFESESIQNQRKLLIEYASARGWGIEGVYIDEDYGGTDKTRPAFNRLLRSAQQGKFEIILCKSQSRFTRDMEVAEKYINNKFLLWGVRFISLVDNVDTAVQGNKKARQINSLVNEWYLEDLSDNIKTVLDYKRRSGEYIASFPLYGYRKVADAKNKIEPDPKTACVVPFIFRLGEYKISHTEIAQILNQLGIPSPARYRQLEDKSYIPPSHQGELVWNRVAVSRILKNEMYIGTMVQGKRRKLSYKHDVLRQIPATAWIRVENNHTPLVSREVFARINNTERKEENIEKTLSIFNSIAFCQHCGKPLVCSSYSKSGKRYVYLRCTQHRVNIAQSRLENIVFHNLLQCAKEKGIEVDPQSLDEIRCIQLFVNAVHVGTNTISIEFTT